MQALLDSLSCVLFFLLISGILKRKYALIIAIMFSLYFYYAINVTYILRETLQSFLALAMCYYLLEYFISDKLKYLIITGVFWGLLILTFQGSLIFVFSIPIFIYIYKKNFIKSLGPIIIVGAIMMITVSPWLIRTYINFPDIRILKSFGTSLTPEQRSYDETLVAANYYGLITQKEKDSIEQVDWYKPSETQKFQISWNGTILRKRDSLNALINEPFISKRKILLVTTNLRNCAPPTLAKAFLKEKPFLAALLIIPIVILCLSSIWGILKFFTKFFKINIVFITYLSIFMILADEKRRMLPIQPFIFLYGIMGIIYLYYRYLKGYDNTSINKLIFLN